MLHDPDPLNRVWRKFELRDDSRVKTLPYISLFLGYTEHIIEDI